HRRLGHFERDTPQGADRGFALNYRERPPMPRLPASIQQFVEQQKTLPVDDIWKEGEEPYRSAYGNYWYRAVGCMLLSGRIKPKANGDPNMTDAVRLCKEANFNQYLLVRIAR